jgi:hypothetical protein
MATRAERFRANAQRHGTPEEEVTLRQARSKPGVAPKKRSRIKTSRNKTATYVVEDEPGGGRPSRRSTRKTSNRAKADTNLILQAAREKSSSAARYEKARTRGTRVRGSSAAKPNPKNDSR